MLQSKGYVYGCEYTREPHSGIEERQEQRTLGRVREPVLGLSALCGVQGGRVDRTARVHSGWSRSGRGRRTDVLAAEEHHPAGLPAVRRGLHRGSAGEEGPARTQMADLRTRKGEKIPELSPVGAEERGT